MKTLKNERGYTLLIVLLTITLMFPIGILLINSNVNSSRQIQATEAYNSSIALAEMGIIRATAEVEFALNNLEGYEIDGILTSTTQPKEINQKIGELIANKIQDITIEFDGDDFIALVNIEFGDSREDQIVFEVTSIGVAGIEYEITADIVVETTINFGPSEGSPEDGSPDDGTGNGGSGGGSTGDFDDPGKFEDWGTVGARIRASVNAPVIKPERDGGTFNASNPFPTDSTSLGFHYGVTLNTGAIVNLSGGMSVSGDLEISDINEVVIGDTLRVAAKIIIDNVRNLLVGSDTFASGGIELTNSRAHIGGNVDFQTAIELDSSTLTIEGGTAAPATTKIENNSVFTMYGDMAKDSPLEINNSTASLNGYTALNGLTLNNATETVRTKNLFVGALKVTDSQLIVNGGLRTSWSSYITNSTVTVQGHLLAGGSITLETDSELIVYGNVEFSAGEWQSINFNGSGSKVIIYGDREVTILNPYLNIIPDAQTRTDCVGSNVVCFVQEDPPSGGGNPGGGSGDNGQGGEGDTETSDGIEFIWDTDFKLQNVQYVGMRRNR